MASPSDSANHTKSSVSVLLSPQTPKGSFKEYTGLVANSMVVVDAEIIKDADRFKMDLVGGLERTLHGQVKPSTFSCGTEKAKKFLQESK